MEVNTKKLESYWEYQGETPGFVHFMDFSQEEAETKKAKVVMWPV